MTWKIDMTEAELRRGLAGVGALLGDVEDYIALKEADSKLVETAFSDARKEWRRSFKRKPLLRWLRERVERYERERQGKYKRPCLRRFFDRTRFS